MAAGEGSIALTCFLLYDYVRMGYLLNTELYLLDAYRTGNGVFSSVDPL